MTNKISAASAVAAMLMCPLVAVTAQAGEFFVGLNAGTSSFDGLNDACDDLLNDNRLIGGLPISCQVTEDSDTTLSVNAGYNFNRYIGLEVGYVDMGEYAANVSVSRVTLSATAEVDYTYAGLVLTAPLFDKLSVSARLGGVSANVEAFSSFGVTAELEDETTGFVGASLDYRIAEKISLQIRYDTLSEADITSAGIRYHF